jgi:hypothetical protein
VRASWPALALLLAGCTAAGGWSKPGSDAAAAVHEYEDCRAVAETVVKTDADIDQDILATRQSDRQRAAGVRADTQTMQEHTGGRTDAIIDDCMRAKGFGEPR